MDSIYWKGQDWLAFGEEEQLAIVRSWDVTASEGKEVAIRIASMFKREFSSIEGIRDIGDAAVGPGTEWVIPVLRSFVYDRRDDPVPASYLGLVVRQSYDSDDLPEEFRLGPDRMGYVWAPFRYERYVDRCTIEIATLLGQPKMHRSEILDAICPTGDFKKWIRQYEEWVTQGKIREQ
jgi:hypothetical protein